MTRNMEAAASDHAYNMQGTEQIHKDSSQVGVIVLLAIYVRLNMYIYSLSFQDDNDHLREQIEYNGMVSCSAYLYEINILKSCWW